MAAGLTAALLLAGGLLAGCGTSEPSARGADGTERKQVLTTFTVIQDMARNVAGDKLDVRSITKAGAEIHEYEPTPRDIAKAQDADLILDNGLNLELWFQKFLGQVGDVPKATLTEGVDPISISIGKNEGKPNPHSWMSPKNAVVYVENIRRAFGKLDPDNAATYDANAKTYSARLEAISAKLEADLADVPQAQRALVSCEGAFSYLTRDFGLREHFLWAVNQEQQGTPQQVKTVIDEVRANQIPAVFCESTVSDKAQQQVAGATGATFGGKLYVDSLSDADGPTPTYLKLLDYDARTIAKGLQGGTE